MGDVSLEPPLPSAGASEWAAALLASSRPRHGPAPTGLAGHTAVAAARWRALLSRAFVEALLVLLCGYALFGKGFAYIGVPPVFVGEMVLLLGLLAWASAPWVGARRLSTPAALLFPFMAWCACRTVPYLSAYGVDAARDGAIWGYALFALVAARLLGDRPELWHRVAQAYRRFVPLFLTLGVASFVFCTYFGDRLPEWPLSGAKILGPVKGGDFLVHLAGAFAYLAATRTDRPWHILMVAVGLGLNVSGRSGLLSFCAGAAVATALAPAGRASARFLLTAVAGVAVLWMSGLSVGVPGTGRAISFDQLATNVQSLTGQSDMAVVEGSKRWRLQWWDAIVGYTVHGPYFWTGKGFGINLADDDGFQVNDDKSLRSPHNGHLTLLARAGVPAMALWALVQAFWAAVVLAAWWRARRRGHRGWVAVFATLLAYWAAFLVNATFDVYLEGPVGGIWFWTVFGVGLAAVRVADREAAAAVLAAATAARQARRAVRRAGCRAADGPSSPAVTADDGPAAGRKGAGAGAGSATAPC